MAIIGHLPGADRMQEDRPARLLDRREHRQKALLVERCAVHIGVELDRVGADLHRALDLDGLGDEPQAVDPDPEESLGHFPDPARRGGALGAGVFESKATFGTGDANYAWNEAVVKNTNASSLKSLCRAATGWGTKTSAATWVATHQITLT